jgi:hypothetical protein
VPSVRVEGSPRGGAKNKNSFSGRFLENWLSWGARLERKKTKRGSAGEGCEEKGRKNHRLSLSLSVGSEGCARFGCMRARVCVYVCVCLYVRVAANKKECVSCCF